MLRHSSSIVFRCVKASRAFLPSTKHSLASRPSVHCFHNTNFDELIYCCHILGDHRALVSLKSFRWLADPPITSNDLARMRENFWEYEPSYSGEREVWVALQGACELRTDEAIKEAVQRLSLSVPTGRLSDGCYDQKGNLYAVPTYCFSNPLNLDHSRARSSLSSTPSRNNAGGASSNSHLLSQASERSSTNKFTKDAAVAEASTPSKYIRFLVRDGSNASVIPGGRSAAAAAEAELAQSAQDNLVSVKARLSDSREDLHIDICKTESIISLCNEIKRRACLTVTGNQKLELYTLGKKVDERAKVENCKAIMDGLTVLVMVKGIGI